MKKALFIGLICLFNSPCLNAQDTSFDEQMFFQSLKDSYYTLNATGLKNFTALITNDTLENFAKMNWGNSEIFPIQLIWFNPDKTYLSKRGVPALDAKKQKDYAELIDGLTQRVRGILVNLHQFYLVGLYKAISEDYTLNHNEQAVQITSTDGSGENFTKTKLLFGHNSLLLQIELSYPAQNKSIHIFPEFRTVKTQWLCEGWISQTFINNEIQDGYELKIENVFVQNVWLPTEIYLKVQTAEKKGATYYDRLKFKNYLFNQSIELVDQPNN